MLRLALLIMQRPAKPCSLVVNSASPGTVKAAMRAGQQHIPSYGVLWRKWFTLMLSPWHALQFLCSSLFFVCCSGFSDLPDMLWLSVLFAALAFCLRSPLKTCRLAAEGFGTGLQTRGLSISKLILWNKDTASFFIPERGKAEDIARQLGWAAQHCSAQRESLSNLSPFPLVPEITVTTWEFLQTSPSRAGCCDLFLESIN